MYVRLPKLTRGDSGSSMINATKIRAKKIWKASGKRHETVLGSKYENPRSSQYDKQIPPVIIAPSIITIFPRLCDLDVSEAHVGTVDVFIPLPKPVMILPTIR